jgi:hypothetical protein
LILDQVTNGVAVRMAVLYLLAGGSHTEAAEEKPPGQKQKRERKVTQNEAADCKWLCDRSGAAS